MNAILVWLHVAGLEFEEALQYTIAFLLYAVMKSFHVEFPYDKIVSHVKYSDVSTPSNSS